MWVRLDERDKRHTHEGALQGGSPRLLVKGGTEFTQVKSPSESGCYTESKFNGEDKGHTVLREADVPAQSSLGERPH